MQKFPSNLQCYKKIKISNKDKAQFFLNKHSTKEGSWGILKLNTGAIEFVFMDQYNNEFLSQQANADNPEIIIFPSVLHKIKLLDHDFNADIEFYCSAHRYFEKKYTLKNVHSDLLYAYNHYIPTDKNLNILDVGCGSGRNLLFLAKQGHYVTGIDNNKDALKKVADIACNESMTNVEIIQADLNQTIDLKNEYYDVIFSTVTLQFLQPETVPMLLKQLREMTKVGGLHLMVFPIKKAPFEFPPNFIYLPEEKTLYEDYQNAGWSLLEYKEKIGQLHKLDEFGYPMQGDFALLLAQRIV